jgi:hypothetical protein
VRSQCCPTRARARIFSQGLSVVPQDLVQEYSHMGSVLPHKISWKNILARTQCCPIRSRARIFSRNKRSKIILARNYPHSIQSYGEPNTFTSPPPASGFLHALPYRPQHLCVLHVKPTKFVSTGWRRFRLQEISSCRGERQQNRLHLTK